MTIAESLLPEFDREMATTRALLERTPEGKAAWKPHPKSTALGQLAVHIAMLPGLGARSLAGSELDVNPPGGKPFSLPPFESTAALLELFDTTVRTARGAIAAASDEALHGSWSLKNGGKALFTMPREVVLRSFMMNHLIHHRGQFSVYLRLNDVPLPSIYGPTADTPV